VKRLDATLVAYIGLTLLALVALAEWADPTPPAGAGCRVGYAYDGDTVELICGETVSTARLIGLDAPELEARCPAERKAAEAAKRALAGLLRRATLVEVRIEGRDKYGRDLIRLILDGADAADILISQGHARPYGGGAREGWC
jgi:endonuclease YncB( thermonuclease family)